MAGIGARLWDRLWELPRPKGLNPFQEIQGARHRAPSTPGDLLLHLRAKNMDVCFELASMVTDRLRGHAEVVDETHGFTFFDERDLLGYVDGPDLKIVRDNRPFGTIGAAESGTYFIGYTKDPAIIERMLRNMFVGDPEGTTDRILDFSTAQTGSLFFVPTAQFMDDDHPAATS